MCCLAYYGINAFNLRSRILYLLIHFFINTVTATKHKTATAIMHVAMMFFLKKN